MRALSIQLGLLLLLIRRFFRRLRHVRPAPVIQVMGNLVALAAFRELYHHTGRMGRAVAILTPGHHLMPLLMAECAGQGAVLRLTGYEEIQCLLMTGAAIL